MAIDLAALLDQLEEWLQEQVPSNIQELPQRMLETAERVTNEIIDSLNMHGPPSISIPFPPFGGKEVPPPLPPLPPPAMLTTAATRLGTRASHCAKAHPYALAAGTALAITAGIGIGGLITGVGVFAPYAREWRTRRRFGVHGVVEDGMLKEAIVLLAPSPTPPLLVPLAATLLKAGYIVVVAMPHVKEAETLERRLGGLAEKSALRVLIYDPEESATFPPFHRSLLATLTLRFPASGQYPAGDPYNPSPAHIPRIHAFISLYPLNPSPPSQPGALPALPTLVAPSPGPGGRTPMLITLYPSTSVLTIPDAFATQVLAQSHLLLGTNLAASTKARIVSVFLGNITLPSLPAIITEGRALSRREAARQRLRESASSASATFSLLRDVLLGGLSAVHRTIAAALGLGAASRDYATFEHRILRILKKSCGSRYYVGQRSFLPLTLTLLPARLLPHALAVLPSMPSETGPAPAPLPKPLSATPSVPVSRSASSSDHEGGEDLASSIHTAGTTQSSADSSGLEGSWIGLDAAS